MENNTIYSTGTIKTKNDSKSNGICEKNKGTSE